MSDLSGKTALVTGASRGIGRASALALAKAGAQVIVHYSANEAAASAVVEEIRKAGGRAEKVAATCARPTGRTIWRRAFAPSSAIAWISWWRMPAPSRSASIEATTVQDFDELFALNVRAPFFLVQQLLPTLHQNSSIVLVSSLVAHSAIGTLAAYAATKGAVDTLVKHFAAALGERGIRVNAVAPGVVETDLSSFVGTDAGRSFTLGVQALKRIAQPDDIAGAVLFLASDAAAG